MTLAARLTVAALLMSLPVAGEYRQALPGYRFVFPRDHYSHPDFKTEWWYFTGNLKAAGGHRFGFELTFFRSGASRRDSTSRSAWRLNDVYLAHLALSDIDGRRFRHFERLNRSGPGLAGASEDQRRIWNGNWQVDWQGNTQTLQAVAASLTLRLKLRSRKPPVIHGQDGVSAKSPGKGSASHYVSLTRLEAEGSLELDGRRHELTGTAWMDHEFFTHQLAANQAGWDWLSLQLSDGTELMLYRFRRRDGSKDPFSSGTYVDATGKAVHLAAAEFQLTPRRPWTSPRTGAIYPLEWSIAVPALQIELTARTSLDQQELVSSHRYAPNYWEGAMELRGSVRGKPLTGVGYLEMTGYDKPVKLE